MADERQGEPDGLALGRREGAPRTGEGVDEKQAAAGFRVGGGEAGLGQNRAAVADFDAQFPSGVTQPEPDGTAAVAHGVGEQLGGEQAGGLTQMLVVLAPQGQGGLQESSSLANAPRVRGQDHGLRGHRRVRNAGEQKGDIVRVVVGVRQQLGQQPVGGLFQAIGRRECLLQHGGEAVHLSFDVAARCFHQAVGVEREHRARLDPVPALVVGYLTHPERNAHFHGQPAHLATRSDQQERQMSGRADGEFGRVRVDDEVAAGDELVREFAHHRVEGAHELPGWHPGLGQGVGGGSQLAHDGGGVQSPTHDVADDDADPATAQGDQVEPVAAHAGALPGREVAARRRHPGYVRR